MTTHDEDPNSPTGKVGLIAVDKIGNRVLFLDPVTFKTVLTLDSFAPSPHELAVAPDHRTAHVPIYGDGKHGDNPRPGDLIAVIDLEARRHTGNLSTAPHLAPHGLRWGPGGELYCVCETSGVVLQMNVATGAVERTIAVGSHKAHRIEILPDGSKLYCECEEDSFASVIDLRSEQRAGQIAVDGGLAGIGISADGKTIVLVNAMNPYLHVVDTATDAITSRVPLHGHEKAAQIARYSPKGDYLVVTSHEEPLATILTAGFERQSVVRLGKGPMNMAFHRDGRTVLIANQGEGTLAVVDLESAEVKRTVPAGSGIETLSFY